MNKHTPGPWGIIVPPVISGDTRWIEGPTNETVARIPWDDTEQDVSHANARLIGAAPELLEELKNVLSDLVYQISAKHGPEAASKYPSVVSARAAIAKATRS